MWFEVDRWRLVEAGARRGGVGIVLEVILLIPDFSQVAGVLNDL